MKLAPRLVLSLLSLSALSALSVAAFAQAPAAPAAPGAPATGNNRGGNPQDYMKRMADRLKGELKATDEEWTVLEPLVTNVFTKQRETRGGFGGFGGRRGGAPSGNNGAPGTTPAAPTTPGAQASQDLRTVLEKDSATPEEIKAKLAAVRSTRQKANADLAQAREELKKVITVRQEAVLVSNGILE